MAYVVYVVSVPNESIAQLNPQVQAPTNPDFAINLAANLFNALAGGAANGVIQVTTRDTDPGVSTSGANSQQFSYSKA